MFDSNVEYLFERAKELAGYFIQEANFCDDKARDDSVINHDFWLGKSVAYDSVAEYIANSIVDWQNYIRLNPNVDNVSEDDS